MRRAGTDWAGIAEAAMILQFYSLWQPAAADSWKKPPPVGVRIQQHRISVFTPVVAYSHPNRRHRPNRRQPGTGRLPTI
jgi:hypothetical protein